MCLTILSCPIDIDQRVPSIRGICMTPPNPCRTCFATPSISQLKDSNRVKTVGVSPSSWLLRTCCVTQVMLLLLRFHLIALRMSWSAIEDVIWVSMSKPSSGQIHCRIPLSLVLQRCYGTYSVLESTWPVPVVPPVHFYRQTVPQGFLGSLRVQTGDIGMWSLQEPMPRTPYRLWMNHH